MRRGVFLNNVEVFGHVIKHSLECLLHLLSQNLRWLEIHVVSSTYLLMGRYDHSLSLDARIMVSENCPTIGEHVVIIFVTQ